MSRRFLLAILGLAGLVFARTPADLPAGPYLGQDPPGTTPLVFAPGDVSTTRENEFFPVFSPDGRAFYWNAYGDAPTSLRTLVVREESGGWSAPRAFDPLVSGEYGLSFSPDGARLFFNRRAAVDPGGPLVETTWTLRREWDRWLETGPFGGPVTGPRGNGVSVSRAGNVYFVATAPDGRPGGDIYRCERRGPEWGPAENLGLAVNSGFAEEHPSIDPDERVLIFSSRRPYPGNGKDLNDLYVSFRGPDGAWSPARNLGPGVNSRATDACGKLTPDGRFVVFASDRAGTWDIYWVSAAVLDRPRAEVRGNRNAPPVPARAPAERVDDLLGRIAVVPSGHEYGGACVRIAGSKTIYVDPARIPGTGPLPTADLVLVTHAHDDHCSPRDIARLRGAGTRIVAPAAAAALLPEEWRSTVVAPGDAVEAAGVRIRAVPAYNLASKAHPRDAGGVGFVIEIDGVRVYHTGDTSFTPEAAAVGPVDIIVADLRPPYQLGGGEAAALCRALRPRAVIPVHWLEAERPEVDALRAQAPPGTRVVLPASSPGGR